LGTASTLARPDGQTGALRLLSREPSHRFSFSVLGQATPITPPAQRSTACAGTTRGVAGQGSIVTVQFGSQATAIGVVTGPGPRR
jgi:hypothetical protein